MKKFGVTLLAFWQVAVGVLCVQVPTEMYIDLGDEEVIQVGIIERCNKSEEFLVLSACVLSLSKDGMISDVGVGDIVQLKIALSPAFIEFLHHEIKVYLHLDMFDSTGKLQPCMTKFRFCGTTSFGILQNILVVGIEHFDHDLTVIPTNTPTELPGYNIAMFLQLFEFANFMKSKNLVYRDFKPENMGYNDDTPYLVHFFDFESVYDVGTGELSSGSKHVNCNGLPKFVMNPNFNPDGSFYWAAKANAMLPTFKDDAENACHVTIARVAGRLPWTIKQNTWEEKQKDITIVALINEHFKDVYAPLAQPLIDLVLEARQRHNDKIDIDYVPIILALRSMLTDVMPTTPRDALLSLLGPPPNPLSSSVSTDELRRSGGGKFRSSGSGGSDNLRSSGSGGISKLRKSGSTILRKLPSFISSVFKKAKPKESQEEVAP